jgi:predicted phosphodiesterase
VIWILGDNHGHFDHVLEAVKATGERPSAVIFLGDLECSSSPSDWLVLI